jgi:hypothetical protein
MQVSGWSCSSQEAEIGRIVASGQTVQKISETPSQPMAGCGSMGLPSQICRKHKWEDCGSGQTGIRRDPISRITNVQRVGDGPQAEEHLPSKHEVLSSSPSTAKKKKRKKECVSNTWHTIDLIIYL